MAPCEVCGMDFYTVYTMENCGYCSAAKALLKQKGLPYKEILVPLDDDVQWIALEKRTGMRTMPQIFKNDVLVGGYRELRASLTP